LLSNSHQDELTKVVGASPDDTSCQMMDLFEEYVPGSLPDSSYRVAVCIGTIWDDRRTLYMRIADATASASLDPSNTAEASATSEPSTRATVSNDGARPTSSSDVSTADDGAPSSSNSKAWIAGAVIGPLFLIALIVLGIWWYKRRSRKRTAIAGGQTLPGSDTTQEMEAKHHSQALSGQGYQNQASYLYDPHHQEHQRWSAATGSPPLSTSPYQPGMHQDGPRAELGTDRPLSPPAELPTQYHR
jgi:hypothetical protein